MPKKKPSFGQRAQRMRESAEALRTFSRTMHEDADKLMGIAETVMSEALEMEASAKRFADRRPQARR